MIFRNYELKQTGNGFEVVLYIKSHHSLEEFAEEFGITKRPKTKLIN